MSLSGSRSPSPKRQRLSSPTYDEQFCLSQDALQAFDSFEEHLSQTVKQSVSPVRPSQSISPTGKRKRAQAIAIALGLPDPDDSGPAGLREDHSGGSSSQAQPFLPLRGVSRMRSLPPEDLFVAPQRSSIVQDEAVTSALPGFSSALQVSREADPEIDDAGDHYQLSPLSVLTPSRPPGFGFASTMKVAEDMTKKSAISPSPDDMPNDQDDDSWFNIDSIPTLMVGFQSAKSLKVAENSVIMDDAAVPPPTAMLGFTSGLNLIPSTQPSDDSNELDADPSAKLDKPGFTSGLGLWKSSSSHADQKPRAKDWAVPSPEALALAEATMKRWEQEMDEDFLDVSELEKPASAPLPVIPSTPGMANKTVSPRPALRVMENAFTSARPPDTPTPAGGGFSSPAILTGKRAILGKNKAFKPPSMVSPATKTNTNTFVGSPLNPNRSSYVVPTPSLGPKLPAAFATPARTMQPPSTPLKSAVPASPKKILGITRRQGNSSVGKPKFVTPFRPGLRPGEPGRTQLEQKQAVEREAEKARALSQPRHATISVYPATQGKGKSRACFFDLSSATAPGRQTLASSGLQPQSYDEDELLSMGINISELSQITPAQALYYSFHSTTSAPPPTLSQSTSLRLGPDAALQRLHEMGCSLATKAWVDNHWGLILWKLTGMVCLQPKNERSSDTKRWCWGEVVKQLLYRYERELNGSSRPALRLITTHDAAASCPMVLCVSGITWHSAGVDEDGNSLEPHPELEITDGWYKLRAIIDGPLERAVRKGTLRVGRKIAIANAKLVSDRKEPAEVLEAYDLMSLQISGNSSHLAPWHTKLGFSRRPAIATLDSLSADGGLVTLIDFTVIKAYPIAFLEFIERDGEKLREGPRNEKEEAQAQEQWQRQREKIEMKLRDDFHKKMSQYEHFAEQLQSRAGNDWRPRNDDDPPSDIEDHWVYLMDEPDKLSQVMHSLSRPDSGWLARHIREYVKKAYEGLHEDIQKELNDESPPRNVRSFRVVIVKDSQWNKREPLRKAQLTIWDVLRYTLTEGGKPGHFAEGQRFLATNLYPTQIGAWMAPDLDSEIFLVTRSNTRISRVKA